MPADFELTGYGPWGDAETALLEWHDTEAIGLAEAEILEQLATVGIYAISNRLWKNGFKTAVSLLITVLEAAFQLGRAVGQMEGTHVHESTND